MAAVIVIGSLCVAASFLVGFGIGYFRGMDAANEIERGNW